MQTKIREPAPSARLAVTFGSRRIGRHACDLEIIQESIGAVLEPARMPRLEGNAAIESFSQHAKKRARDAGVECEARR